MCHLVLCFVTWFLNHFMHGTHFSLLHIDVAKNARPAECWVILCARHEDYVGYSKQERKVTKYQVKLTRHKHGVNQTIKAHCWCNRFPSDLFSLLSKKYTTCWFVFWFVVYLSTLLISVSSAITYDLKLPTATLSNFQGHGPQVSICIVIFKTMSYILHFAVIWVVFKADRV